MDKKCVCLLLLGAIIVSTTATLDYWSDEYDNFYDDTFAEENPIVPQNDNIDKKVDDEIQLFRNRDFEPENVVESLEDYQIEDNRSKDKEEIEEDAAEEIEKIDENIDASDEVAEADFDEPLEVDETADSKKNENIPKNNEQEDVANDYALLWGDIQEQAALSEIKHDEQKILDETQAILEADNEQGLDFKKERVDDEVINDGKLLEETRQILENSENDFANNEDTIINGKDGEEDINTVEYIEENQNKQKTDEQLLQETRQILEDSENEFENNEDTNINGKDGEEDINTVEYIEENQNEQKTDEQLLQETRQILEDSENDFENNEDTNINGKDGEEDINTVEYIEENQNEQKTDEQLLQETRQILEDSENDFENNEDTNINGKDGEEDINTVEYIEENQNEQAQNQENSDEEEANIDIQGGDEIDEEIIDNNNESEDTADKVYSDLNAELEKLLETIDKLSSDDDPEQALNSDIQSLHEIIKDQDEISEDTQNLENSDEDEANIDIQGDEIANNNADLDPFLEKFDKINSAAALQNEKFQDAMNMNPIDYEEKYGVPYREGNVLSAREDYDNIFDDNDKSDKAKEAEDELDDDSIDTALDGELFPDDGSLFMGGLKDDKEIPVLHPVDPLIYANDAFVDDETDNAAPVTEKVNKDDEISANEEKVIDKISVDDLLDSELDDLMEQFSAVHKDELDTQSDNFDQNVAPVHITLSVNESVVVTSPNYPSAYPTNNIIDWMFDGEGTGIELNITDFAVNGALGDYLLIKPGGLDATGQNGLILSYRLDTEKRYRFLNVDRMFVRFESKPGMSFLRGFKFSVKLISPLPSAPEPVPDPEPIVNSPTKSLTLNLGGVTLEEFRNIEEEFRLLIADMAAQYITDQDINPGLNSTIDITQITSTALCNIHWPEYETCAEVTFGIPLWYEGEDLEPRLNEADLQTMWRTYITRDPFALRLRRLGITEFAIPNDSSVLAAWLAIAGGVVICMGVIAVGLWRFSCSENYTRMKAHSDTDSLRNEKRGLDLYPTPHQTLPPLYSENEYKWSDAKYDDSTRVDMGGFANKSYARDDLFDLDSDEDIVTPRDSSSATKQKDFFKNV